MKVVETLQWRGNQREGEGKEEDKKTWHLEGNEHRIAPIEPTDCD